uniref:Putative secreted protein n=1 Tax=Ixodes ricinus TaxID=34613 RepID=A0A6B0U230_IXORI
MPQYYKPFEQLAFVHITKLLVAFCMAVSAYVEWWLIADDNLPTTLGAGTTDISVVRHQPSIYYTPFTPS